jgi:hypothetical protein
LKLSEEVMLVDFIRLDYNRELQAIKKLLMKKTYRQSYAVPTA